MVVKILACTGIEGISLTRSRSDAEISAEFIEFLGLGSDSRARRMTVWGYFGRMSVSGCGMEEIFLKIASPAFVASASAPVEQPRRSTAAARKGPPYKRM
jgi:hypothetical protein